ncbi:MAG: glycosyltransferase family 2 protein [Fimbriimonas ginsengisoli]|uniref:Glycosyltransferase family 2 protein n=1 Tax=Fimbriimonas ginsengisoli TaxID=1005039 RepID=A0A931LX82_FIMGI|nr:glycosyltransferase family 2 protein [Fimbriimonas ginsengisoli]
MKQLVSVVIASYGHAAYLRACVRSGLAQTWADLEILIIDDCSDDGSWEIAEELARIEPRVRAFRNERNLGTYGALNAGLDAAQGDWVAILNSDDLWQPMKLDRQMAALSETGGDWAYTRGKLIDSEGKPLPGDPHGTWPTMATQDLLPFLLDSNRILASSLVFCRGAARFRPNLRYTGDWLAALSLAERGPATFVDEPLVAWRQHEANSYRRSQALTLEEISVRRAILRGEAHWLKVASDSAAVSKGLGGCALALSALYVLVGQMRLARAAARTSARLRPGSQARRRRIVTALPRRLAQTRLWPNEAPQIIDLTALLSGPADLGLDER